MTTCRGCHGRLKLPAGSSGFCNPCFLAVRVEKLVFTRVPPDSADRLFNYLRGVVDNIENACERFEADRTASLVTEGGAPIPGKSRDSVKSQTGPDPFKSGEHQGRHDPDAGSAAVKVKKEHEGDKEKEPVEDAKPSKADRERSRRRRRRTRSKSRRERSSTRRRASKEEAKKDRGKSPVKEEEELVQGSPIEVEDDEEIPWEEEDYDSPPEVKDDDESDRKYSFTRTAKPSARKPLPRRPRTPSHSPPRYYQEESQRPPRWKGYKHVLRGQYYSNRGSGHGKGKGKGWRRK